MATPPRTEQSATTASTNPLWRTDRQSGERRLPVPLTSLLTSQALLTAMPPTGCRTGTV